MDVSMDLLFCTLQLLSLSSFKKFSRHDNNYECIILAYMQHSQPHMILYCEVIFLNWGWRIFFNFESLMMILLSSSLDYLIPPSSGLLSIILCSSCTDTFNYNFDINYFLCYHPWRCKDNNLLLYIAQPSGGVESNCKELIWNYYLLFMTTALFNVWPQYIA